METSIENHQELLILDHGGQVVFYTNDEGKNNIHSNQTLIAASYLTAILQFAKVVTKGNIISSFEFAKSRIFLKLGESLELYYVLIAGNKISISEKKLNHRLTMIAYEFENRFSLFDLEDWDGSTDFFETFSLIAKNILHF